MARIALAALMLLAAGCQQRGVELVPVTGRVLVDGAPPPSGGTLFFTPSAAAQGHSTRPGSATFAADGTFQAGSFDGGGDGLIPGRYQVAVHCWDTPPTIDGPAPKSHVPLRYATAGTSGLVLVVEPGSGGIEWNAELTAK